MSDSDNIHDICPDIEWLFGKGLADVHQTHTDPDGDGVVAVFACSHWKSGMQCVWAVWHWVLA